MSTCGRPSSPSDEALNQIKTSKTDLVNDNMEEPPIPDNLNPPPNSNLQIENEISNSSKIDEKLNMQNPIPINLPNENTASSDPKEFPVKILNPTINSDSKNEEESSSKYELFVIDKQYHNENDRFSEPDLPNADEDETQGQLPLEVILREKYEEGEQHRKKISVYNFENNFVSQEIVCPHRGCGKKVEASNYELHIYNSHCTENCPWKCPYCAKQFVCGYLLEEHLRVARKFACTFCDQFFHQADLWKAHIDAKHVKKNIPKRKPGKLLFMYLFAILID